MSRTVKASGLCIHRLWPPLVIVLAAIVTFDAYAQAPFSRIDISAGRSFNVKESDFTETRVHQYWRPGRGGELSFLVPFYLGDAEVGAALHRYESADAGAPGFFGVLAFFGWGYAWEFLPGISWYNGLRMGSQRMSFEDDTFPGVRNESEFLVAYQSRAAVHFLWDTGVFASAQLTQTYTYVRFRTVYVSVGLTTSLSSPRWLQSLLR